MGMVLHFLDGEDLVSLDMSGFVDGGEGSGANFVDQLIVLGSHHLNIINRIILFT